MHVKETAKKGLKREYQVTVTAAEIAEKTDAQLQQIGKTAKISGFRPGHIPAKVLKQRYGKSVMGEVLERAVHDATHRVINDNKLRPAMQPEVKVTSFDEGKDLELAMTVEIFPDIPAIDLEKITLEKPTFEVGKKDLEEALTRLAERNKKAVAKKDGEKAQHGDVVTIDFKGLLDGVAFDGGTAHGFRLELGSGQFIPGFEDQLVGSKKGDDVKVNVTFPEAYHNVELAGKPVVFEVTVHEVLANESPAVDEEFANGLGFEELAKLEEAVKDHMEKDYAQYVRNRMKKALFDALEDVCSFEVPEGMVKTEFGAIWEKLKQAQAQGDPSVAGRDDKELKDEYQQIAERRVRLGIFLAEYGRDHKIEVTREELMSAVIEQARMYPGQEQRVVEFYQKNPAHVEELRGPIFEDKVVDLIIGKVKTTDKKMSLEELVALDMEEDTPRKTSAKKEKSEDKKASDAAKKPAAKKAAKK